ncbi:hypothetical protein HN51_042610 [Arachis hypogaea]
MLYLTKSENWSPHPLHQVTKIFASNLNTKKAERVLQASLASKSERGVRAYEKREMAVVENDFDVGFQRRRETNLAQQTRDGKVGLAVRDDGC